MQLTTLVLLPQSFFKCAHDFEDSMCCLQAISDDNFHVGFNKIYDKNLARSLRNIVKRHAHLFRGLEDKYDLELASRCTSIREFDDAITRRTFGETIITVQCCISRKPEMPIACKHIWACVLSFGHLKPFAFLLLCAAHSMQSFQALHTVRRGNAAACDVSHATIQTFLHKTQKQALMEFR